MARPPNYIVLVVPNYDGLAGDVNWLVVLSHKMAKPDKPKGLLVLQPLKTLDGQILLKGRAHTVGPSL